MRFWQLINCILLLGSNASWLLVLNSRRTRTLYSFWAPSLINVWSSAWRITHFQDTKHAKRFKIRIKKLEAYFTGTGDLFSALLLGYSILQDRQGRKDGARSSLEAATWLAVSALQSILTSPHNRDRRSVNNKFQELNLISCGSIIREVDATKAGMNFESWEDVVAMPDWGSSVSPRSLLDRSSCNQFLVFKPLPLYLL